MLSEFLSKPLQVNKFKIFKKNNGYERITQEVDNFNNVKQFLMHEQLMTTKVYGLITVKLNNIQARPKY